MPVVLRALSPCAAALIAAALGSSEAHAQPASPPAAPSVEPPPGSAFPSDPTAAKGPAATPGTVPLLGLPPPPAAPSASPLPGYYPPSAPPYYGPPQYYYTPGGTLPLILPYEPGQPVPPGYRVKTRASRSLLISGAVTFGVPYVVSALIASTVLSADTASGEPLAPLFIPFAGPFITIGTTHAGGVASFWLVLDGLAQIGGAALFTGGLLTEDRFLQRVSAHPAAARLLPEVRVAPGFTSLRWRF
jgi:hypothetical protein